MGNTKKMVMIGSFIAIEIILTRFLSIQTPIIRFGFGFIPLSFSAMLFGPAAGAITGALAEIMGMMLFPKGAYFPGFTVSAALSGAIYGMYFYKKPKKDRKSTRLNSSHANISYAVFCLKKKKTPPSDSN